MTFWLDLTRPEANNLTACDWSFMSGTNIMNVSVLHHLHLVSRKPSQPWPWAMASFGFTSEMLCLDFATLKYACPKGIYVAPSPENGLRWSGVVFLRKGPFENAIFRFRIAFPAEYPSRPPIVTFLTDLFHPLVAPLTTYTYSTRDTGTDTVSAQDEHRLPPGGLSLRHGFPEWFDVESHGTMSPNHSADNLDDEVQARVDKTHFTPPHIVEVLQYIRVIFDSGSVIDTIPLELAANSGAWHAWNSFRSKASGTRAATTIGRQERVQSPTRPTEELPSSPRQQPGGARRPGEWNWNGVWEDRVRKSITASIAEPILFGGDGRSDMIGFLKMDPEDLQQLIPKSWSAVTQPEPVDNSPEPPKPHELS